MYIEISISQNHILYFDTNNFKMKLLKQVKTQIFEDYAHVIRFLCIITITEEIEILPFSQTLIHIVTKDLVRIILKLKEAERLLYLNFHIMCYYVFCVHNSV